MDEYFDILKVCPLFADINNEQLRSLLKCLTATRRSLDAGEFVFHAGDTFRAVGVVLRGSVHVLQEDYLGNRKILAQIEPGNLFAEAFACAEVDSVPVSAAAAGKSEILLIDYRRIVTTCAASCEFHAKLIGNMMRLLAQKNILLTQKMEIVTHRTTRERLLAYLSAQAAECGRKSFAIPFNRQQLADFLSVERSAMSAELSRMQSDGLIRTNKFEFELLW